MSIEYSLRLAHPSECERLPPIEQAAARAFRDYPHITGLSEAQLEQTNSVADFAAAQMASLLWVAVDERDEPIGFALLRRFDSLLHLHEIDVLPKHARRGVGRALLNRVCEWGRERGAIAITLTTYREIAWNAPFYRRMGFRELTLAEWRALLPQIYRHEQAMGWRIEARVAMRRDLE